MMSMKGLVMFLEKEILDDPKATVKCSTLLEAIRYNEGKS